jgi:hypothetical protein
LLQDIRRRASRNGGEPGILKGIIRGGAQILVGNVKITQTDRQIKLAQELSYSPSGAWGVVNRPNPLHRFSERCGNQCGFFGMAHGQQIHYVG